MGRPKLYSSNAEKIRVWRERNKTLERERQKIYTQRYKDKNRTAKGKLILENKELLESGQKKCSRCLEIKESSRFDKKKSQCKDCCNAVRRSRYPRKNRKRVSPEAKKLRNCVSTHIRISLKDGKGGRSWERLVGYSITELMAHLEKKFKPGMNWSNQGKWHIDHIIPVSAFNFTKSEDMDFKRCWALSNLQPLWAIENIKKNARLEKPFQPSLAI